MKSLRVGFTLIELLVVIAIIAVLSVVVVLSLNPAELLRQSRDANRLSDLSTLNSALALYTTDQAGVSGFSLGNASSVYVSLPDTSSTCGTWNLPTLPSGYTYACSTSTSSKNINNSGWIPVNFGAISGGAPFSNLPVDSTNQSSTGLYYTYYSNGSQFIVTAIPESQKQKQAYGAKSIIQNYPKVFANGSNMTISPIFNTSGLVGYWPLDEGTGTIAGTPTYDLSGSSNNGSWNGTAAGTSGYYSAGKVGPWAGWFNGSNNSVSLATSTAIPSGNTARTISLWFSRQTDTAAPMYEMQGYGSCLDNQMFYLSMIGTATYAGAAAHSIVIDDCWGTTSWFSTAFVVADTNWHFAVAETDGNGNTSVYIDGASVKNGTHTWNTNLLAAYIGRAPVANQFFPGLIDDVRIYNRALSAAEIQALYNAEK